MQLVLIEQHFLDRVQLERTIIYKQNSWFALASWRKLWLRWFTIRISWFFTFLLLQKHWLWFHYTTESCSGTLHRSRWRAIASTSWYWVNWKGVFCLIIGYDILSVENKFDFMNIDISERIACRHYMLVYRREHAWLFRITTIILEAATNVHDYLFSPVNLRWT